MANTTDPCPCPMSYAVIDCLLHLVINNIISMSYAVIDFSYVRLVMSMFQGNQEEIKQLHPRFAELKVSHGIEEEKPLNGYAGPQKMASGLIFITLKCVGASMGEKPPMTKKVPATTTVGKLKIVCQSFFKLRSIKPVLFLKEEGSPLPALLDDDMASLIDFGVGNESTILVDEESCGELPRVAHVAFVCM